MQFFCGSGLLVGIVLFTGDASSTFVLLLLLHGSNQLGSIQNMSQYGGRLIAVLSGCDLGIFVENGTLTKQGMD